MFILELDLLTESKETKEGNDTQETHISHSVR